MADGTFPSKLKARLNRWTLCLIIFAVVYACILAVNLSYSSMEWDEVSHFTGGLLLSRGQLWQWVSNNSFYPPAYDTVTAFYYLIGGASVFAGRLVALTFSVLSLFVIYETAKTMYGAKTAFISAVFLGVMPGIVWASRMAMIETMLLCVFSVSMFFFYRWLTTHRDRDFALAVAAVAVGVAVKYQMLVVAPIIMLLGVVFWKRDLLKAEARRYLRLPRLALIVAAVGLAAFAAYEVLSSGVLSTWFYAIQIGGANKAVYSARYPLPIFYFVEVAWLNNTMHPVSLLLYLAGLAGISLLVCRRGLADKFLLLWFTIVYIVFTLIPNREWRYVSILFPVLAISASVLLAQAYDKIRKIGQTAKKPFTKKWGTKLAAALLITFVVGGVAYSCFDAYRFVAMDTFPLPAEQATNYAAQALNPNQTILVACPVNRLNQFMIWFYLNDKTADLKRNQALQYPEQAVDAFTPDFNMTEVISLCEVRSVKFVLMFEYGATTPFFDSTLNEQQIYNMLEATARFTLQASFGDAPNRLFVFSFA
jgi:4-amino-4-deoxy-L-arabinose transferase-like glycosyltransferase